MSLTIEQQRELCARFMGYNITAVVEEGPMGAHYAYVDGAKYICPASLYRPGENIQQADELWHKLYHDGHVVWFEDARSCLIDKDGRTVALGQGSWWPAALTAAVAELQTSLEHKEPDDDF